MLNEPVAYPNSRCVQLKCSRPYCTHRNQLWSGSANSDRQLKRRIFQGIDYDQSRRPVILMERVLADREGRWRAVLSVDDWRTVVVRRVAATVVRRRSTAPALAPGSLPPEARSSRQSEA